MEGLPKNQWVHFGAAMILHGRYTCTAANPKCGDCILNDICPKIGAGGGGSDEADDVVPGGDCGRGPGDLADERVPAPEADDHKQQA